MMGGRGPLQAGLERVALTGARGAARVADSLLSCAVSSHDACVEGDRELPGASGSTE